MTMMIPFFFDWAMCSQTLSSPAIAWLAKPQAEERRGWEADSASKPAPTASDSHSSAARAFRRFLSEVSVSFQLLPMCASEPKNLETPLF